MPLSIGIVGLPNVGKSTLFNALTKKSALSANYPFCTIDPNVGIVSVPDERLEQIAAISQPRRIVPTTVEFIDIAGLVKGAHAGEGLGNQFLGHIRACDAICEVVRDFADKDVVHVQGRIDPDSDRETVNLELILADLAAVEKKLAKAEKEAKGQDQEARRKTAIYGRLKEGLAAGTAARAMDWTDEEKPYLQELSLLSAKPILYCLNTDQPTAAVNREWDGRILPINAKLEEEIVRLEPAEQAEYIRELGLKQSGLDKLIAASYQLLGLITFFTTGPDETRAWTTRSGSRAPAAAGRIHSDFEKKFIRAEIVSTADFLRTGGESAARNQGLLRTEGKEYMVQDGDICHFLIGA